MFVKSYLMIFIITLMSGTLIAISANSWFTSWLGLEINLMSMIPLMLTKLDLKMTEASIKYFMAQAMASLILIFSIMFNYEVYEATSMEIMEMTITIAMLIKAGMAPFHYWFPQVINNSEWTQCLILMTWQKIAPFMLLTSLNNLILIVSCVLSALVGCLGGFNQTKIKIMLTYSSITHSAWMIMACLINNSTWMIYFSIYSILSISIISFFKNSSYTENLNEINSWPVNNITKNTLIFNILSLGGLPPLLGFMGKMLIVTTIINTNMQMLIIILIISSLISLYFYCRLIYSSFMIKSMKLKIKEKNNTSTQFILPVISTSFNIVIPLIIMFN